MKRSTFLAALGGLLAFPSRAITAGPDIRLPMKPKSTRFAVIGDSGTGEHPQFQVGDLMARYRQTFSFDSVVMLGDNIYGDKSAKGFKHKFEEPYKDLLSGGVKFYGALGNHDHSDEIYYKPFNMNGKRYYKVHNGDADLLALDSDYMDPAQLDWTGTQLADSNAAWKICFFHHPLYTHAKFHGEDVDLKSLLEPVLIKSGANVVLNGHQHVYERMKRQNGIDYFVVGSSGQLRMHDLAPSPQTAKGFDTDQAFMLVEIVGDEFNFQTISRAGDTVDSGVLKKG